MHRLPRLLGPAWVTLLIAIAVFPPIAVGATGASAALGAVLAPNQPPHQSARDEFAGLVDIGGRRLYLECRGAGSLTVILESGYRTPASTWSDDLVQPQRPRTMTLEGVAA